MQILHILNQKAYQRQLEFLVVGGHAVSAHGFSRQTGDLDLLVREEDRSAWREIFISLGYKMFYEHSSFMQFSPPELGTWPLDLMFVDNATFSGMLTESLKVTFGDSTARIPSVEHLLALKLHALKQGQPHRIFKDLSDIINLVLIKKIDVHTDQFRQLCEKYGNIGIYEKISDALNKKEP